MEQEINQCIDAPDTRDWKFSEFIKFQEFAQWNNLVRLEDLVKIQNQWSVWACSDFGMTHIVNWYNVKEWKDNWQQYKQLDAMIRWNNWDKVASLQGWLKRAKKEWLIDWRLRLDWNTVDEMNKQVRQALNELWKLIYTWNSNWDWTKTKTTKILQFRTDWKFVWHCWDIVKEVEYMWKLIYRCPNSYWEWRSDKWYFHLDPKDILKIYSKYVVLDHDDSNVFKYFKALQYAKESIRVLKKLYPLSDRPVQEFFEKAWVGKFLMTYYKLTDADII